MVFVVRMNKNGKNDHPRKRSGQHMRVQFLQLMYKIGKKFKFLKGAARGDLKKNKGQFL